MALNSSYCKACEKESNKSRIIVTENCFEKTILSSFKYFLVIVELDEALRVSFSSSSKVKKIVGLEIYCKRHHEVYFLHLNIFISEKPRYK